MKLRKVTSKATVIFGLVSRAPPCCKQIPKGIVRLKCDGTRAETRFRLSLKRTSPFKSAGRQFSRLLAAEVCASELVMLDTPRSEVGWSTGYQLHSPVSPSLPLPCVTVCHQVSNALYVMFTPSTRLCSSMCTYD